ncbi:polyamine aminopropyltransferase [Halobaculum rubrum]|uniref:polyamine aminopropyltransferase n=1 Tax=Halobaculum rubrum TaxID=2872158 RepID=UPI001CA3A50C|nr:polyamine aminopropyltransferase [Halobaculum rubrum]QZY01172.1 polyamine aminopropyltransferase [Halobaculum rubrum]
MTYDTTETHWFANYHSETMYQYVCAEPIHVEDTSLQKVTVLDSERYGRIMTLEGEIQIATDCDHCVHEPMIHPAMLTHPDPQDVLVIGGGDGGSSRELLKHDPRRIDVVELDKRVVEVCKSYFPEFAAGFDDDRVTLHFEDGREFVRETEREYDVVVLDISDPKGPASSVFTREFYTELRRCLRDDGVLVTHCESPDSAGDTFYRINATLSDVFEFARPYRHWVPAYIDFWGRTVVSDAHDPLELTVEEIATRLDERGIDTEWLTPDLCHAMFRSLNKRVRSNLNEEWPILTEEATVEFTRP